MVYHVNLGFRNGVLLTVIISKANDVESAIDVDYYVADPQEAKKQVEEWLKELT